MSVVQSIMPFEYSDLCSTDYYFPSRQVFINNSSAFYIEEMLQLSIALSFLSLIINVH